MEKEVEEEERRVLREAFGDSCSESGDDPSLSPHSSSLFCDPGLDIPVWEPVDGIKGLWLCSNFLSPHNQSLLLSAIHQEGWFSDEHNQAMRFGDLPKWAKELSRLIHEAICNYDIKISTYSNLIAEDIDDNPLPFDLLWREPLFDQLIANVYNPGEGICSHVDLMRFEDGIAIISLESECVMHFTPVNSNAKEIEKEKEEEGIIKSVPVYLNPGSLVLMSGEARYLWKHGINRGPGCQIWEGREIVQQRRISITLRKLCPCPNSS